MSGLGPAACWLAHKRLESWSRLAKERVGGVRKSSKSEEKPSAPSPINTDPNADAISSSTEDSISVSPGAPSISSQASSSDIPRSALDLTHSPQPLQHQSKSFPPRLQRAPSISSQSSLDSTPTRQSGHRGSSPQIRTFGPDGRTSVPSDSPLPISRATSPMRAVSLDARCSPSLETGEPSPSHSLASLATSSACATAVCLSPKIGRCLSPLLIPARVSTTVGIDSLCGPGPASPLGALQPDLYQRQEGPIYLTAPDADLAMGRLHLRIEYDSHLFDLTVHLIEAHNICPIEEGGFRDPYVRLMLCPEVDNRTRGTTIHSGESHVHIDQHFKFPISRDQLPGKELVLQVLDSDRYSHNDILGEVRVCIDDLDLSKSSEIWGEMVRGKKPPEDRPELLFSLNYLPQAERLTIVILSAKHLPTTHDVYTKIHLIVNGKRVKKKKTTPRKCTPASAPAWNEAFTFNVSQSNLQNAAFEIYVLTSGSGTQDIGSCGIGPMEHGRGRQHWQDMIHNARKPTAMWHYLR